jgi:hypothetical protein
MSLRSLTQIYFNYADFGFSSRAGALTTCSFAYDLSSSGFVIALISLVSLEYRAIFENNTFSSLLISSKIVISPTLRY